MNMESNCLSYALRYWNLYPEYRLYYNSDHCVNLPIGAECTGFLPIEEFGYDYFFKWYEDKLIDNIDLALLNLYFQR
jgi:hypothetical protein